MPTFVHGKNTFTSVNAVDLSTYMKSTDFNDGVEMHDTTTYSATRTRKTYQAGLGDGKISQKGVHSSAVTAPRKILKALMAAGTIVPFILRHEGTGAGKPQSSVNVLVSAYNESIPVDDMITFSVEYQMTDTLTETDQ